MAMLYYCKIILGFSTKHADRQLAGNTVRYKYTIYNLEVRENNAHTSIQYFILMGEWCGGASNNVQ